MPRKIRFLLNKTETLISEHSFRVVEEYNFFDSHDYQERGYFILECECENPYEIRISTENGIEYMPSVIEDNHVIGWEQVDYI